MYPSIIRNDRLQDGDVSVVIQAWNDAAVELYTELKDQPDGAAVYFAFVRCKYQDGKLECTYMEKRSKVIFIHKPTCPTVTDELSPTSITGVVHQTEFDVTPNAITRVVDQPEFDFTPNSITRVIDHPEFDFTRNSSTRGIDHSEYDFIPK